MCGIVIKYGDIRVPDCSLAHRGPDDFTEENFIFNDSKLIVRHWRLAVVGNERQPCEVGRWKVWFVGCIYNFPELASGATSDTHALAAVIDREGFDKTIERLNGMFVIVAFDGEQLKIATDRLGIKPFYIREASGGYAFANEIKAIVPKSVEVERYAIQQYFTFQNVLTRHTPVKGVMKVPPATIITITDRYDERKYWKWKAPPEDITYDEAREELKAIIPRVMKRQSVGAGGLGVCLSGGVDSAIIAAHTDSIAFTCGFPGEWDERRYAEMLPNQHYEVVVKDNSSLPLGVQTVEELLLGPNYPNVLLAGLASKYVRVLFDGAGGDEFFYGYTWRHQTTDYWKVVNRTGIDLVGRMGMDWQAVDRELFDITHFLRGLFVVFDKCCGAVGIEGRVPMCDNELVDFAQRIPKHYRFGKKLLKDAVNIPQAIKDRKKVGFTTPDALWLQSYQPTGAYRDYVDVEYDRGNPPLMWCIASFEAWLRQIYK